MLDRSHRPSTHASARNAFAIVACAVAVCACGGGAGGSNVVGANGGGASGGTAPGVTPQITLFDVAASPYALWADEAANAPITITARSKVVGQVALELSYFDGLVDGSGARLTRPMYDDGTHGDAVAGDGVWTLTFALGISPPSRLRLYDGDVDSIRISIGAKTTDGKVLAPTNEIDASVDVALVARVLDGEFHARALDASMNATETLVNVVDPRFDGQTIASVTERLYGAYADDPFDFVVLFQSRSTGDAIPRSVGVENDVVGIHVAPYDHSADYGSAGRLKQVVLQNAHALGLEVNHEIGHRWAAYLSDPALDLTLPTHVHWGASDHVGQMGNGPYLLADGDGYLVTNANGSDEFVANPFSSLELYLMGLARPEEVAPLRFVTDPAVAVQFGAHLPATATREVTIDDIVGAYGARLPVSGASQNRFAAAFVVVSDRPLSNAELALGSWIARYAGGTSAGGVRDGGLFPALDPPSFAAATTFRATLETELPH